jgi:hypothetical protein
MYMAHFESTFSASQARYATYRFFAMLNCISKLYSYTKVPEAIKENV